MYRRRTDNTMAKRKRTKGQTTIYKTLYIFGCFGSSTNGFVCLIKKNMKKFEFTGYIYNGVSNKSWKFLLNGTIFRICLLPKWKIINRKRQVIPVVSLLQVYINKFCLSIKVNETSMENKSYKKLKNIPINVICTIWINSQVLFIYLLFFK